MLLYYGKEAGASVESVQDFGRAIVESEQYGKRKSHHSVE